MCIYVCSPGVGAGPSTVTMTGGLGSPARSVFDPYDTTSLHIFIREAFPGAILLEEHQVFMLNSHLLDVCVVVQILSNVALPHD